MKPVRQIADNCFGACMAMLTGKSQLDFPIDGYGKGNKHMWADVLRGHGYQMVLHTESLPDKPFVMVIELSDNADYSHAVVIDENKNIIDPDPAGLWQEWTLEEFFSGCNTMHSEFITLEEVGA